MYLKAFVLHLIKNIKKRVVVIGKHKLNEMGALNMKKIKKLDKRSSYNPVF